MGKDAPSAPDPYATAAAQTQSNVTSANYTAQLNRINQYTPYGSMTYTKTAGDPTYDNAKYTAALQKYNSTPIGQRAKTAPTLQQFQTGNAPDVWTQNVSLSPDQQQLYNTQVQGKKQVGNTAISMLGQVQNSYAKPIDYSGAPGLASSVNNSGAPAMQYDLSSNMGDGALNAAANAAYQKQTAYLDPQYQQNEQLLKTQLANQGLDPNSQAYTQAMGSFNRDKAFNYDQARTSAINQGINLQQQLFGQAATQANLQNSVQNQSFNQGLSNANLQNQSQAQYLQQLFAMRNQPLNEYNALMTGAQVTNPTFQSVPQGNIAAAPVGDYINQNYTNKVNQANAGNQALGSALGSGAAMAMMMA